MNGWILWSPLCARYKREACQCWQYNVLLKILFHLRGFVFKKTAMKQPIEIKMKENASWVSKYWFAIKIPKFPTVNLKCYVGAGIFTSFWRHVQSCRMTKSHSLVLWEIAKMCLLQPLCKWVFVWLAGRTRGIALPADWRSGRSIYILCNHREALFTRIKLEYQQ